MNIEPILKTELSRKLKKAGFEFSKSYSGRISGWGNSSEGIEYGSQSPWIWRWQRNNRRMTEQRKDPFDKVSIKVTQGTFGLTSSLRGENKYQTEKREKAARENARLEIFLIENRLGYVEGGEMFVHLKNPNL